LILAGAEGVSLVTREANLPRDIRLGRDR
jgi:hypothetical protein